MIPLGNQKKKENATFHDLSHLGNTVFFGGEFCVWPDNRSGQSNAYCFEDERNKILFFFWKSDAEVARHNKRCFTDNQMPNVVAKKKRNTKSAFRYLHSTQWMNDVKNTRSGHEPSTSQLFFCVFFMLLVWATSRPPVKKKVFFYFRAIDPSFVARISLQMEYFFLFFSGFTSRLSCFLLSPAFPLHFGTKKGKRTSLNYRIYCFIKSRTVTLPLFFFSHGSGVRQPLL